jgi:hypothetical protein
MGTPTASLYEMFADKLSAHPELLAIARENCARWLREGHSAPQRLREWDALLAFAQTGEAGQARLREVLKGSNELDARLRDFHPLAGILTREERRSTKELMRLPSLKHLVEAVHALAQSERICVLGFKRSPQQLSGTG